MKTLDNYIEEGILKRSGGVNSAVEDEILAKFKEAYSNQRARNIWRGTAPYFFANIITRGESGDPTGMIDVFQEHAKLSESEMNLITEYIASHFGLWRPFRIPWTQQNKHQRGDLVMDVLYDIDFGGNVDDIINGTRIKHYASKYKEFTKENRDLNKGKIGLWVSMCDNAEYNDVLFYVDEDTKFARGILNSLRNK